MKPFKLTAVFLVVGAFLLAPVVANAQSAKEWVDKGIGYSKKGDWKSAIESCNKALEIDPNYKYAHNNLGWYYINIGKHKEAINHCTKAISIDPNYSKAYDNRGIAHYYLKK